MSTLMVFIRHRLCLYRESYFTVQVERLVHNLVLCFILKPLRHTPTFFQGKEKIKKREKGEDGERGKKSKSNTGGEAEVGEVEMGEWREEDDEEVKSLVKMLGKIQGTRNVEMKRCS